ncbi:MAG: SDR family oxidoreductase [Neisseriaceae bacterium]|nr:SDR family oxidoreductase [Neisseriaceae bacterium]
MKNILVIGATSAIASACIRLWADKNVAFFLSGRNSDKLNAIADDCRVRGAETHTFCIDIADIHQHEAMFDDISNKFNNIDIVLIAHGTLPEQSQCEKDIALTLQELNTNAVSTIALLTRLANIMEQQGKGSIAVITSVAGDRGRPTNYVYGSAKAAVAIFCEGLRARLFKSGVFLTDIRPGFVDTPMTQGLPLPQKLVASPDSVAKQIVKGIERHSNVLYVPKFWALIMLIIRSIPHFIFKRLKL